MGICLDWERGVAVTRCCPWDGEPHAGECEREARGGEQNSARRGVQRTHGTWPLLHLPRRPTLHICILLARIPFPQGQFAKYLEERGITAELGEYLRFLIYDKEQREYQNWLSEVETFVSSK